MDNKIIECARRIKLLILDVDGVLTNGQVLIDKNGDVLKSFNTLDGHGIKMLQNSGVSVAIITARSDAAVTHRVRQLEIKYYVQGAHNKKDAYLHLLKEVGILPEECAMVGDDVIDLPIMITCGLPIAVNNAHDVVKQYAIYTTQQNGGLGAVREVTDLIMMAQDTLRCALDEYLK